MAKNGGGADDATSKTSGDDQDPNAKLKQSTTAKTTSAPPASTKAQVQSTADEAAAAREAVDAAKAAAKAADDAVAEARAAATKARLELDMATRRAQEKANNAKVAGEIALKPGEDFVVCMVPKEFLLTLDDCSRVHIKAGLRKLPKSVAEHWYAKANGVHPAED